MHIGMCVRGLCEHVPVPGAKCETSAQSCASATSVCSFMDATEKAIIYVGYLILSFVVVVVLGMLLLYRMGKS